MKRISILTMVVLLATTSMAEARRYGYGYRHGNDRHRVRWSIHTQSLISGDLYYSPHAFQFGSTGLVPYWVRYSPYAYSFEHPSGLVNDFASYTRCVNYRPRDYSCKCASQSGGDSVSYAYDCGNNSSDLSYNPESYERRMASRRAEAQRIREARKEREQVVQEDGSRFVSNYLKSRDVDFKTQNYLRIDSQTVSVSFVLEDKNMIVKYWNPDEIDLLESKSEYKRNAYIKYLKDWNDFCAEYVNKGGKVCQIVSAAQKDIYSKLMQCRELDG
jgi:hypothetical protein